MSWESEQVPAAEKDRTKLLWLGVAAMVAVMVGIIWYTNTAQSPQVTRARVKHILVSFDPADPAGRARALDTANSLREQLVNGASFARLAKDFSNEKHSAERGGDLGWIERGQYDPPVEDFIWQGPLNTVSEVIQSSFGFHILLVTDRNVSDADRYELELRKRAFDPDKPTPAPPDAP